MESPGAANSKNLNQSTSVNYSCRRHNATVASQCHGGDDGATACVKCRPTASTGAVVDGLITENFSFSQSQPILKV